MKGHEHTWGWLGETRESQWEWCEKCGAIRRTRDSGVKGIPAAVEQAMKLNREALSAEYDRLYDAADHIIKAANPCGIQKEADGRATCNRSRRHPEWDLHGKLCCGGCKHLGPDGCTVRSLGCKLGSCSGHDAVQMRDSAEWPETVIVPIQALIRSARDARISLWGSARCSKEDYLNFACREDR